MSNCYCGSSLSFENCCKPIIDSQKKASSAEELMRSRYSAYCVQNAEYLLKTTHKSTRKFHRKSDILDWSKSNNWLKLEIISSSEQTVEFKAFYIDSDLNALVHHEKSTFLMEDSAWFYKDGIFF
ncbi:MAG: YchJ family protein [Flavobacterium sp.]